MIIFAASALLKTLCFVGSSCLPEINLVTVSGKAEVTKRDRISKKDNETPSMPY